MKKRIRLINSFCKICNKQLLRGNTSGYCRKHFSKECLKHLKTRKDCFCIDCGKLLDERAEYIGTIRCRSCSKKEIFKIPENNPHFKHGRSIIKHFCKECNKEISYVASEFGNGFCKSCWQLGNRNSSYKNPEDRKKYYCSICGKERLHHCLKDTTCFTCAIALKQNHTLKVKDCDCCACKSHRGEYKGENHPNYINGHGRHFPYPNRFNNDLKLKIRTRDRFCCQNCGISESEHLISQNQVLHIHHIDYNIENCNENNLITLCLVCNIKANYNRDIWKDHYKNILMKRGISNGFVPTKN